MSVGVNRIIGIASVADKSDGSKYGTAVSSWPSTEDSFSEGSFAFNVDGSPYSVTMMKSTENYGLGQKTKFNSVKWSTSVDYNTYQGNVSLSIGGDTNTQPTSYTFPVYNPSSGAWSRSKGFPKTLTLNLTESEMSCIPVLCKTNYQSLTCTSATGSSYCDTYCSYNKDGLWKSADKTCQVSFGLSEVCFAVKTSGSSFFLNDYAGNMVDALKSGSSGCFYDNGISTSTALYPARYTPLTTSYGSNRYSIQFTVMHIDDPLLVAKKEKESEYPTYVSFGVSVDSFLNGAILASIGGLLILLGLIFSCVACGVCCASATAQPKPMVTMVPMQSVAVQPMTAYPPGTAPPYYPPVAGQPVMVQGYPQGQAYQAGPAMYPK